MEAVIFDMDGVMVDTMNLHHEASSKILSKAGGKISAAETKKFDTMRTSEAYGRLLKGKPRSELKRMEKEKYGALEHMTLGIKTIPGFREFFSKVKGKFPLGIVSSSRLGFIKHIVEQIGEKDSFGAIIGAESVSRGKPDPEGFLKAAKILGIAPEQCLAIEDSIFGIKAAKSAGMKCVAVTNTYDRIFLLDADLIVESLAQLSIEKAEALFSA